MITIAQAHPMAASAGSPQAQGRVTWLRDLGAEGEPLLAHIGCPMVIVPAQLQSKDWTRYEGVLHTDHAVLADFFTEREDPITATQPYLLDFTYLYDKAQEDFVKFMAGVRVAQEEVYAETGRPETWATRDPADQVVAVMAEQMTTAKQLLAVCQAWGAIADYLSPELPR